MPLVAVTLMVLQMNQFVGICDAAEPWPTGLGVSLAGPEFGLDERNLSNRSPGVHGVDFLYNSAATTRRVAEHGFRIVRLPFRWERIQPRLGEPLDASELGRLDAAVEAAGRHKLSVILDLHNYGRYRIGGTRGVVVAVLDARETRKQFFVGRDHLADLWRRLAEHFRSAASVVAYGIMNEPHDLGEASWKEISQAAVDAIRSVDRQTWVCVGGDEWSHADRFEVINGTRHWIKDPVGRTAYEAHCYFDFDRSGRYRLSYDDELRLDKNLIHRGTTRIASFLRWLRRNDVPGIVGEVGVPIHDERWKALLADLHAQAKGQGVPVVIWAAGEWWGDYPLSIQPLLESGGPNAIQRLGLTELVQPNP